jgi:hypothetical protein
VRFDTPGLLHALEASGVTPMMTTGSGSQKRLADDQRVAGEPTLPLAMADHSNRSVHRFRRRQMKSYGRA